MSPIYDIISLLYDYKYKGRDSYHLEQQEHICISVSALTSILESRYILSPKATKAKTKRMQQLLVQKQAHASTKKEKETLQSNDMIPLDRTVKNKLSYLGVLLCHKGRNIH